MGPLLTIFIQIVSLKQWCEMERSEVRLLMIQEKMDLIFLSKSDKSVKKRKEGLYIVSKNRNQN